MKNPFKILDYENWWKKYLGNIKDYVIPTLNQDIVKKNFTPVWMHLPKEYGEPAQQKKQHK